MPCAPHRAAAAPRAAPARPIAAGERKTRCVRSWRTYPPHLSGLRDGCVRRARCSRRSERILHDGSAALASIAALRRGDGQRLRRRRIVSNRTCIVTGGSRGIGLATAMRFARRGDNVVIAARNAAQLEAASREIQNVGAACEAVPVDVSTSAGAQELVEVALGRFERVDVLVNNAGAAPCKPLSDFTDDDFRQAVDTNIGGVFFATRAVWPAMRRQGAGVIVSVSSMASFDPFPGLSVYGGAKAWVNVFTRAAAAEGKPLGIRVFAVAPGAVETRMLREAFPDFPAERTLAPDAVAAVIESLCEDAFADCVGQTITVAR
ncbi:MAG: SDR family oxidoreductase [Planctomycetota bacterium]|nr:MAG: SDR family oxidoreductase [Planctomycetota bacterium]